MTLLVRNGVLLAKVETTPGTDAAPVAADGNCNFFNVAVVANIPMTTREGQGGAGKLASVPGGYGATVTFRTYCEWDGTSTEPFWADVLLPAVGWIKDTNTFTPRLEAPPTNVKTLTFYHYFASSASNGKLTKVYGAMGTGQLHAPTGQAAYIDWTFTGVWGGVTDVGGAIPSPTYPTDTTIRSTGVNELGDVALCASEVVIDFGNTVTLRECKAQIGSQLRAGFESAIITDRTPTITVDPEAKLVATRDAYGAWINMTEATWELDLQGPTNSLLTFDAPKAQIITNANGDRNGLVVDQLQLQCNKNGATHNQELSIVFTPAS